MSEPDPSAAPSPAAPEIDRRMIESLVCPITHGPLELDVARRLLISRHASLAFPIRDGIPIMLESEAVQIEE